MPTRYLQFTFSLLFYTIFTAAFAQGSWQPAGANTSFPRTMLQASEIAAVQQSLLTTERQQLYANVYGWAMTTPPATNTADMDRRMRARAAKNAAFVRIMDRKPSGTSLELLTAAEKTQLETNVIGLLESLNTSVDSPYSYEKWQWRSKELIDYLIAYDMLRGAGVPAATLQTSKTKLQDFAGNLYSGASQNAFIVGVFLNTYKNNHLFMTAAALGMAGVVLNDATSSTTAKQPTSWINAGMYAIDNVMWRDAKRQSEPGEIAGYAEGPYYFKYAMLNCLPFFRAFGNFLPDGTYSFTWNGTTRQIRNPYFDPNYDLLYQWMTDITMPDGRFPALEDSYIDMAMPELAIAGKPQYVRQFNGQNLDPGQLIDLNAQLDGTVDLRVNYLAANVDPAAFSEKTLTALPTAGNLIFRSGTGFSGNYMHVYGKNGRMLTNSGGHNHGDASSFILYAHGQLLALDAGYLKYDRRSEVGNATNHNLILVNGQGPVIGSSGSANDAEAFIQNSFEITDLGYGEVKTTYSGATITRKTMNIRGEYYLMADFISASSAQNYTWQLHGFGLENGTSTQGTFTDNALNHEGTWLKNGVSLKAHVTATNGATTYTKTTSIHENTYDQTVNHTTMLVNKNNVAQTQFLATLNPFLTAAATTTTLNLSNMAGLVTSTAAYTDLTFTKNDTLLQTVSPAALPAAVNSDAWLTFFSVDKTNEMKQIFLQNGTKLTFGTNQLISSNRRADLAWSSLAGGNYEGYVSKAATLQVKTDKAPVSVSGKNLSSWTYNAATGILTVVFSQPSAFQYKIAQNPLPVELVGFSAKKLKREVLLTWQTASEKNNRQFHIQRSGDSKTWETIATQAGQGTTNTTTHYQFTDKPDFSGPIFYRLGQEDLDGTVTYSEIKVVYLEKALIAGLKAYPNPANRHVMLEMQVENEGPAQISIRNSSGQTVWKMQQKLLTGVNQLPVELPALPAGIYLVTMQTETGLIQTKFLKQ